MTFQNAGLGYFGYLDSPAGQSLPSPSGSTPGGAQFQLMTQNEINDQPPWARQLEEEIGITIGLVILTVATAGTGDAVVVGAEVGEQVATAAVTDVTEVTISAEVAGAADGMVISVPEDILADSFLDEIYGSGEAGLTFGDDISAIGEEVLDNSDLSIDGLGDDVEVWAEGAWTDFEGEVAIDVDAFEEPMIWDVDEVSFQDEFRTLQVDAEADAEKETQKAMQKAIQQAFSKGFF